MHAVSRQLVLAVFWDAQLVRWTVWVGLVALTVSLLLLIRTRWGHSKPLGKCIVMSLLAHLLLGIYMTTVNIVTDTVGSPDGKGIQVAIVDSSAAEAIDSQTNTAGEWDALSGPGLADAPAIGTGFTTETIHIARPAFVPAGADPQRQTPETLNAERSAAAPPALPSGEDPATPAAPGADDNSTTTSPPEAAQPADPVPPPEPPRVEDKEPDKSAPSEVKEGPAGGGRLNGKPGATGAPKLVPEEYRLRLGDHSQVAKGFGASPKSEAAVTAALRWLAANQTAGGRWNARQLGAGNARAGDGQDRGYAGSTADTGISGLVLLAFLAGGHTHLQGSHQSTVRRGLEFLLSAQASDGNLGSSRNLYEKMYCHAMATCALSEAYAMSGDERLAQPLHRAVDFTLAAQDRRSGGWRYSPGDPGDTSQLGWQVMALKSAHLAGIDMPDPTRAGIERFLKNVAGGRERGLAYYQAIKPVPSRSMTAEALVCRQFLGIPDTQAALGEAREFLLQEIPGVGTTNFYYWYYGTLAMYQLQGDGWQRWNDALQTTLLASQRQDGAGAGSWDPDPVWGGCGGRAYSTALATLCLEVYYRFLPLYVEAAGRDRRAK